MEQYGQCIIRSLLKPYTIVPEHRFSNDPMRVQDTRRVCISREKCTIHMSMALLKSSRARTGTVTQTFSLKYVRDSELLQF